MKEIQLRITENVNLLLEAVQAQLSLKSGKKMNKSDVIMNLCTAFLEGLK